MKKQARTFMPFHGTRDQQGNPVLSPTTDRSVVPANNVYTIQDIVFDGRKYRMPGMSGAWGVGEEAKPGSYKEKASDYKLKEEYLSDLRKYRDQEMLGSFMAGNRIYEKWGVVTEGGMKVFDNFALAQLYKEKIKEEGVGQVYLSKLAQTQEKNRVEVIADSINKCFMVESKDAGSGTIETGSAFCVFPNMFITCAHVVHKYDKNNISDPQKFDKSAKVRLIQGGKMYNAKVLAVDLSLDIALIECDVRTDVFEIDNRTYIGEDIISIGSPHGYENNVSVGNLSSAGKRLYFYKDAPDYMFVDLSIFPGNSGGPVIKASNGKVIGLITLIVSETGTYGLNAALQPEYIIGFCRKNISGYK